MLFLKELVKTFVRGKEDYSLAEKKELGELVEKDKKEYNNEVKALQGKTHCDYKQKQTRPNKTKPRVSSNSYWRVL